MKSPCYYLQKDHFYCGVTSKKNKTKNFYICTVYTILADYIFPSEWLSVGSTGFNRNYFVYLKFFFLLHLIKKKGKVRDIDGQIYII